MKKLNIGNQVERFFVIQQAQNFLKKRVPHWETNFSDMYAKASDQKREYLLGTDLIVGNETAFAQLLKVPNSVLAIDLLNRLPVYYSSADAKLKNSIVKIFALGMDTDNQQGWKSCLTRLIKLNRKAAFQMCMRRLKAGDIQPYQYFLDKVEDKDYAEGVKFLSRKFSTLKPDLKRRFVLIFLGELKNEAQERREVAFSWLQSSEELGASVGKELSTQFRQGVDEDKLLVLEHLARINGDLVKREAGWTVESGDKTHFDALVSMRDEQLVVQNLIVFLKNLLGKEGQKERSGQITRWVLELLPEKSISRSATLLLLMSLLDTDKAFDVIKENNENAEIQELVSEAIARINVFGAMPQSIKGRFLDIIKVQYELNEKTARDILDGKITLIEELYPFQMRQREEGSQFQIEELVNEPDERITGSHVSVWEYKQNERISQVIVSGHANKAVCKEVSAKLASAQLRLGHQAENNFLITGGAYLETVGEQGLSPSIKNKQAIAEKPPLEDFIEELRKYEQFTGMVKIHTVDGVTYEDVYRSLKKKLEEAAKGELPVIVKSDPVHTPGAPVYLPFFKLNKGALEPVEFTLDMQHFGKEFHELLSLHRDELYHEMIADAKRRKQIYEDWLQKDQRIIKQLTNEMFIRLAKTLDIRDPSGLADKYLEKLLDADRPYLNLLPINVGMEICVKELIVFIQQNSAVIQRNWKSKIQAAFAEIQKPEITISGSRDYDDASVVSGKTGKISLLDNVGWNLPGLVKMAMFWIEQMDKILDYIDDSNPERSAQIDKQNLDLFVDSFLRGWPSVFLTHKSQQDKYDSWCEKQRKPVWQAIWKILMERNLQMTPLQEDNVVFRVTRSGQDKLTIKPHYLTTENSFLVALDKRIGMTYYLNPWQHRKAEILQFASKEEQRQVFNQSLEDARQSISIGDAAAAADKFKLGIKTYPIIGTEALLENYWQETKRDTQNTFRDFSELAVAIINFWNSPQSHAVTLSKFIDKYPDFLPDPYLYLGFYRHEQADNFYLKQTNVQAHILEYNLMIEHQGKYSLPILDEKQREILELPDERLIQPLVPEILISMREDIETEKAELADLKAEIWKSIRLAPDENVKKALILDSAYVNGVFESGNIGFSTNFIRYIGPFYQVLRGRSLLNAGKDIIEGVYSGEEDLISKLKDRDYNEQQKILSQLADLVDAVIDAPYLESNDKKLFADFKEFIEQRREVDSITRESILPRRLESLYAECLRQANKAYENASKSVHWLTEVNRWLTDSYGMGHGYAQAINSLLGFNTSSLFNAFPNMKFEMLDTQFAEVSKIKTNPTTQTIEIMTPDKKNVPVLHLEDLREEDWAHLSAELEDKDFVTKVNAAGLSPAYALLFMSIKNPPRTKVWKQVIQELRPMLIQSFARLAILPMEGKVLYREEGFIPFDSGEIVDSVEIPTDSIGTDILINLSN